MSTPQKSLARIRRRAERTPWNLEDDDETRTPYSRRIRRSRGLFAEGEIVVANSGSNSITVYAAGATGNVAPIYSLTGANTLLNLPIGIAFDYAGNLDVANSPVVGADSVLVFSALGGSTLPASGNIAPNQNLTGAATLLAGPFSAVTN